MKYSPQIHHRRSIRLKGYDYSQNGLYFVTICLHNQLCLLGKIIDGEVILNDAGVMVKQYWMDMSKHFPEVILHESVIMPNHVHGIIELQMELSVGANEKGQKIFCP